MLDLIELPPGERTLPKLVRMVDAAGYKGNWPQNVMRHSFVSYHLAQFGDIQTTALEAGHSPDMLFRHYRELVTKDAAAEFWSITPPQP